MRAALRSSSLQQISSILRQSSPRQGVCSDVGAQTSFTGSRHARSFVATPPLWRSRIPSKYSKNQRKADRPVKEVSRVRHGPNLAFKALNQTGLQELTKAVVLGSLLGDSTLHVVKGENDARFLFRVSERDEEYFRWKASALAEISSQNSVHLGASNKFLFRSRAVDSLTKIHSITHNNEELVIRKRWLNHFTPVSLAVWWCDAGTLNGRKSEICTDAFSEERVLVLSKYLENEWMVRAHVGQLKQRVEGGFVYRLSFRTEELKKFLRVVLPHIPVASMLRKCLVVNHSPALQESWIEEMKAAVPHFATYIDEELLQRRTRASKLAK